ncbi:MAG: DUF1499 domain-containing protein [Alphaproteobacteria bacterium]|nr:DUF1499 domain-containing protein [Alphaproteobacteria bacterium]
MNKTVRKILYVVLAMPIILVAVLIGLWWTAADLDRQIDFRKTVLVSTPNQYLVCPPDYCKDKPHMISPVLQVPRAELEKAWDAMMDKKVDFVRLNKSGLPHRRHYEQRSKLLRYPDRVTVEFQIRDDATSSLAIYSRSKYGYSDGGVNEARVKSLLRDLRAQLP